MPLNLFEDFRYFRTIYVCVLRVRKEVALSIIAYEDSIAFDIVNTVIWFTLHQVCTKQRING